MRLFIKKIISSMGKTTIIVLNNPEDAIALSDYMIILDNGNILQSGPSLELYNNPKNPQIMEITSPMGLNKLKVNIEKSSVKPYNLKTDLEDGDYYMYFRPNDITIDKKGIKAKVLTSGFYNSTQHFAECELESGEKVKLLLPLENKDSVLFVPGDPRYF